MWPSTLGSESSVGQCNGDVPGQKILTMYPLYRRIKVPDQLVSKLVSDSIWIESVVSGKKEIRKPLQIKGFRISVWLRGQDLNL